MLILQDLRLPAGLFRPVTGCFPVFVSAYTGKPGLRIYLSFGINSASNPDRSGLMQGLASGIKYIISHIIQQLAAISISPVGFRRGPAPDAWNSKKLRLNTEKN
jgi:hypothetical protein